MLFIAYEMEVPYMRASVGQYATNPDESNENWALDAHIKALLDGLVENHRICYLLYIFML